MCETLLIAFTVFIIGIPVGYVIVLMLRGVPQCAYDDVDARVAAHHAAEKTWAEREKYKLQARVSPELLTVLREQSHMFTAESRRILLDNLDEIERKLGVKDE